MQCERFSRRLLFRISLGAGVAGFIAAAKPAPADEFSYAPQLAQRYGRSFGSFVSSLDGAYAFIASMMDAYAQGSVLRLAQSYSDQQGLQSTAFTYDNAVIIDALLIRGMPDDEARASILGNALLHAQSTDSYHDGRLRQAYFVNAPDAQGAYVLPAGAPFYFYGSSVGDLSWAGMALLHLYNRTRVSNYLTGATALANWIYTKAADSRGAGGYTAGVDAGNNKLMYKATEHNIDAYAFFTMLATLSGDSSWNGRAQSAFNFVASMWNASGGFFWTGTGNDGVTPNTSNIPEDVQTWSYLAFLSSAYAASLDWVTANLATIDTPQTINSKLSGNIRIFGESYASASLRALTPSASYDQPPDPNAVWLEGTSHTAAALFARGFSPENTGPAPNGDAGLAFLLLENVKRAQQQLGHGQSVGGNAPANGQGVVAASSVCNTGFGSSYYPNLHIGSTGWYVMAAQMADPFQLGLGARR
jgi:hypothetical protein